MILKFFRKPKFATILAILFLTISCTSNNTDSNNFDYKTFETFKKSDLGQFIAKGSPNARLSNSFEASLTLINNEFSTDLTVNYLDNQLLLNKENIDLSYIQPIEIIDDYLNQNEKNLIDNFDNNVKISGFDVALNQLQNEILNLNLSSEEFQKYNAFVNILLLIDNYNPDLFVQNSAQARMSPCAKAIAANALATIGLAACGTGFLCAVAIAAKVLAMDAVMENCAGKPFL